MSHVTDIILVTAIEDKSPDGETLNVEVLDTFLAPVSLRKTDQYAGGGKAMQCDVFMAAKNYMDIEGFVSVFNQIKWEMPECVQLFIKDEHDDLFTEYRPSAPLQ